MMGVAVLMVGVERAGGWNGGSPLATRQGENEALNGVLNGGWWRQKKCCPKVPISYVFRGVEKMAKKWGWSDSWGDKWGDFFCNYPQSYHQIFGQSYEAVQLFCTHI